MASLLYLSSFLTVLALTTGAPSGDKCCTEKTVGGVEYRFVRDGMTGAYGCLADCIYEMVDSPGSMYCFAAGDLKVECEDAPSTYEPSNSTGSAQCEIQAAICVNCWMICDYENELPCIKCEMENDCEDYIEPCGGIGPWIELQNKELDTVGDLVVPACEAETINNCPSCQSECQTNNTEVGSCLSCINTAYAIDDEYACTPAWYICANPPPLNDVLFSDGLGEVENKTEEECKAQAAICIDCWMICNFTNEIPCLECEAENECGDYTEPCGGIGPWIDYMNEKLDTVEHSVAPECEADAGDNCPSCESECQASTSVGKCLACINTAYDIEFKYDCTETWYICANTKNETLVDDGLW